MDRRALFFLAAGAVSAALAPLTDVEQRWIAVALAALYAVLAMASFADSWSRRKSFRARPTSDTE